jgi:hypothetical protein
MIKQGRARSARRLQCPASLRARQDGDMDEEDPLMSEQLAAEIREALARVQRGQVVDLGSFAQYADDGAG